MASGHTQQRLSFQFLRQTFLFLISLDIGPRSAKLASVMTVCLTAVLLFNSI